MDLSLSRHLFPRYAVFLLVIGVTLLSGCRGDSPTDVSDAAPSIAAGERLAEADPATEESDAGGPAAATSANIPVLELTPQAIKTFRFTWEDVDGRDEYVLLEDPDGVSGYSVIARLGTGIGVHEHEVFLPLRINARYVLQACNADGCVDSAPVNISGTLAEAVGYFKASNPGFRYASNHMPVALSADGKTMAFGVPYEASSAVGINGNQSDRSMHGAGAVYVFTRRARDGRWIQDAYVKASNNNPQVHAAFGVGNRFGMSLAFSADGRTLAVGAPGEYSAATGINGDQNALTAYESGAVYVFTRGYHGWRQEAYIKASNTETGDLFGEAIDLSDDGNTLAVGARNENSAATGINGDQTDNSIEAGSGAVYVFVRKDDSWFQQAYIKASNNRMFRFAEFPSGIRFGSAVALSGDGDTLAVQAVMEPSGATGINGDQQDTSAPRSGAVYVFSRNGDVWHQEAFIKSENPDAIFFGYPALSADGNALAVAHQLETFDPIYVYVRNEGVWTLQERLRTSDIGSEYSLFFGNTIAISANGDVIAVGSQYERSAATGIGGDDKDTSAEASGAVNLFVRRNGSWEHAAYVKAPNTDADDRFGFFVALSADASVLAVSAPNEASRASGIGGDQTDNSLSRSGAVYLY